jgi:hypothetical protein
MNRVLRLAENVVVVDTRERKAVSSAYSLMERIQAS